MAADARGAGGRGPGGNGEGVKKNERAVPVTEHSRDREGSTGHKADRRYRDSPVWCRVGTRLRGGRLTSDVGV